MRAKHIKILFCLIVIISCSKDSDEIMVQENQLSQQSENNSTSSSTTGSETSSSSTSSSSSSSSTSSSSSSSSTSSSSSQSQTFDRGTILSNYSENIIIPRYNTFKESMDILKNSITTFVELSNSENYDAIQSAWIDAYKKWQYVEMFNISKAEEVMYNLKMNTYPHTKERADLNIENEKTDLSHPNDWSAQGFPAIDYMLHGIAESKEAVIDLYVTNNKYGSYLSTLGNLMSENTNSVVEDWASYKDTFNASSENTATSAFNMMVNDFVFYFEKGLRTNKIGIPAGRFSSGKLPTKIEAYYYSKNSFGNLSKTLLLEARQAVENLFLGKNNDGSEGPSYKSYLDYLESDVASIVSTRLDEAKQEINKLDDNFLNQIETNNTAMLQAFDILQKIVVNLKTDMLSNFNVAVDYTDADGD